MERAAAGSGDVCFVGGIVSCEGLTKGLDSTGSDGGQSLEVIRYVSGRVSFLLRWMAGGYYVGVFNRAGVETIYSIDYAGYVVGGCVAGEDGFFTRFISILYFFYTVAYILGWSGVSIFRLDCYYFYIESCCFEVYYGLGFLSWWFKGAFYGQYGEWFQFQLSLQFSGIKTRGGLSTIDSRLLSYEGDYGRAILVYSLSVLGEGVRIASCGGFFTFCVSVVGEFFVRRL